MRTKTEERLADMKIAVLQAVGGKADEQTVTKLELHLSREDALNLVLEDLMAGKLLGMQVVSVSAPETKIIREGTI